MFSREDCSTVCYSRKAHFGAYASFLSTIAAACWYPAIGVTTWPTVAPFLPKFVGISTGACSSTLFFSRALFSASEETPSCPEFPSPRPVCKKESVSLVWAISRRNVVGGKYLPGVREARRVSLRDSSSRDFRSRVLLLCRRSYRRYPRQNPAGPHPRAVQASL